ncbi:MAG TPA: hypothetical protein VLC07_06565 [Solirubrobacterales bacterium]|nr:hypothetical protein [Solirubrobacterales bacterium]
MSVVQLRICICFSVFLLWLCWHAQAPAETVPHGKLRVSFSGKLQPNRLPRKGAKAIAVAVGGRIYTTDGSDPPPLRRIAIAINANGHLDPAAVPSCRLRQIQPASTEYARRVCGAAEVGEGTFSASVAIPEQAPYPSRGIVTAFNGREGGRPVIYLHIYGTRPLPTSFTLPLQIRPGHGQFGTVLTGDLPSVDAHVGFVTGISLRLDGGDSHGTRRPYLSAGCPAPDGFPGAIFPLARVSFGFAQGPTLGTTLVRNCRVR